MYSRTNNEDVKPTGSHNMHPSNGRYAQGGDSSNYNYQKTSCLSEKKDQKMDFSIFHGQNNATPQRKPLNNIQSNNNYPSNQINKNFQEWNQPGRRNMPQNDRLVEQSPLRDDSLSLRANRPQVFRRNEGFTFFNSAKNAAQRLDQNRDMGNPQTSYSANTSKSSLGLMNVPKQNNYSAKSHNATPCTSYSKKGKTEDAKNNQEPSSRMKKFGETDGEKLCIFTGTVERVIKWGKIFQNLFCYYEVIASVISIADGKVQFEKIMLLRDKKGPILQVTYYSNATHINIEDFHLGQILRAVGRMIGPNIMSAITIRAAKTAEHETLPRMCHISDKAVSNMLGIDL